MNYYMNSLNNSYLAVHTDALCANVAAIEKTLSPGAEIIPVLKCDAYGLSLSLTAPALAALPGIRTFALAHVSEGLALRTLGIPSVNAYRIDLSPAPAVPAEQPAESARPLHRCADPAGRRTKRRFDDHPPPHGRRKKRRRRLRH